MGYRDLKHGDKVAVKTPQGHTRIGTVNGLLIFEDHVVLDMGGPHGTPQVCNDRNYAYTQSTENPQ